jgi:hypothetical protein
MPTLGPASTIRVYHFGLGHASAPQGGGVRNSDRSELRHAAKQIWEREIATLEAKAAGPAIVVQTVAGPDLFMAALVHPRDGVLKVTAVAIEG